MGVGRWQRAPRARRLRRQQAATAGPTRTSPRTREGSQVEETSLAGLWRTVPVAGLKLWDISSQLLSVTPSTPCRPRLPVPAPRPTRPSSSKSSTKARGNHGP